MHHLLHAGSMLADYSCDVCDFEIESADPVVYDLDGDVERVRVVVIRHRRCHLQLEKAEGRAKVRALKAAYEEAARLIEDTPKDEAIEQCRLRANAAAKEAYSGYHSGADLDSALFSGLTRQ
jgi:hypothetical protein